MKSIRHKSVHFPTLIPRWLHNWNLQFAIHINGSLNMPNLFTPQGFCSVCYCHPECSSLNSLTSFRSLTRCQRGLPWPLHQCTHPFVAPHLPPCFILLHGTQRYFLYLTVEMPTTCSSSIHKSWMQGKRWSWRCNFRFLRYESHLFKAVGLNEIIYRMSISRSRTKVQENNKFKFSL